VSEEGTLDSVLVVEGDALDEVHGALRLDDVDDAMFTQARRDSRTIEIRRRVWCEMRRRGCSYGAIARVCGMSHSSVMLAVQLADKSS
jgi:hypothetical protein